MSAQIDRRLAELGLTLPEVPAPVAAYVPAVVSNGFVYTSGQLAFVDGALLTIGKVGRVGGVTLADAVDSARAATLNALAAAGGVIGSLDRVTRVVKVVGFVASDPTFTEQPKVVDGASRLLVDIFGAAAGAHARSAVGVAALPLDGSVEIELILEIDGAKEAGQ